MLALAKAEKQRSCLCPLSLVAQKLWTPEIKSGPEIVGHLTPALGKLRHDLLVQPYVHFRRAVERASVASSCASCFRAPRPLSNFSSFIRSTMEGNSPFPGPADGEGAEGPAAAVAPAA